MTSDDERREAAQSLKHYAHDQLQGGLLNTLKLATGIDGTWRDVLLRLADLIEPDMSTTPPRRVTDASATVGASQMEQLLALAGEMDAYTGCDDERCGRDMPPRAIHDYARRIREALGVEDFKPYAERCATASEEGCSA